MFDGRVSRAIVLCGSTRLCTMLCKRDLVTLGGSTWLCAVALDGQIWLLVVVLDGLA